MTIKLWDVQTRKCINTFVGHTARVNSAMFNHDSKKIVSASDDKTVKVWDVESGVCLDTFYGHKSCVNSAKFSPQGNYVLSSSDYESIMWEMTSLNHLLKIANDKFAFDPLTEEQRKMYFL